MHHIVYNSLFCIFCYTNLYLEMIQSDFFDQMFAVSSPYLSRIIYQLPKTQTKNNSMVRVGDIYSEVVS